MVSKVIIPRGLERQVELSLKSIRAAIDDLSAAGARDERQANQIFALQNNVAQLERDVAALRGQVAADAQPAPGFARHFMLMGG